jgi:hypothetical protein
MTVGEVLAEKLAVCQRRWERSRVSGEPEDTSDLLLLDVLDARLEVLRWQADEPDDGLGDQEKAT